MVLGGGLRLAKDALNKKKEKPVSTEAEIKANLAAQKVNLPTGYIQKGSAADAAVNKLAADYQAKRVELGLPSETKAVTSPEEIAQRKAEGQAYIQEREKLASKEGISSEEAARQLIGSEETKLSEKVIQMKKAQIAGQSGDLAQQQLAELQQIDLLKSNSPGLTPFERNVQAGVATGEAIAQGLGLPPGDQETPTGIAAYGAAALGTLAGTRILGFSVSSLFDTSGNVQALSADVSANVQEAQRIARAATSKGADLTQAINSLQLLEESTRAKYNSMMQSIKTSPGDIKDGLDVADDMSYSLRAIVENRQALERYALTGDVNEVLLLNGLT